MESQLYSISKIFTEKIYRIPDYQRGYAWGIKQLKEFWTDLVQLEVNNNHYFGVLTLEAVSFNIYNKWVDDYWIVDSKSFEPYFIVDGQQRLTTTIILLQAIIETADHEKTLNYDTINEIKKKYIFDTKDKGLSKSFIFGYEKDNPSYEYLKTQIFLENSESAYLGEETIYTTNLLQAKNYFLEQIKSYAHSELENLYKKITQNLLFNTYSISSDLDVFITFETMNNRGKPLSNLELLKNRLIYLSTKLNCDEDDRSFLRRKINDSWKAVYHFLGKNKNSPLDDDHFLRFHYFFYNVKEVYKKAKGTSNKRSLHLEIYNLSGNYAHKIFNELFTVKRTFSDATIPISKEEINKYVCSLASICGIWFKVHNPILNTYFSIEEQVLLEKMNRLEDFHDIAPILVFIYSKKKLRKSLKLELLETIERVSFIKSLFYSYDSDILPDFELLAAELFSNEIGPEDLLSQLKMGITNINKGDLLLSKTTKYFNNRGFYNWENLKYFLFEYEEALKFKSKNKTRKISWDQFQIELEDYNTVEHIFPQKATDSYWKQYYSQFGIREKRQLCDSLGNLLPLSKAKNSSLQNYSFPIKVESNKEIVGYRFGSYSEIEVSKLADWTAVQILDRGLKLLKFMETRWGINLGTPEDKRKILGIEFLGATN
ncbi:DUF262 domain-containing protein [Chitinophaga silvisoli]|uniref:DUF262 domain-containing protein n=1 Tax=Chitinophaga silvisoli TaxID=2291814 RepID=A0A3E1NUH7_9BACT|nr:DUF262 domain-containing protein [Chitinophaga silvisoli]RFM31601.1 DUF262 domain-containing protein [Chitinophaga silvisoli]